MALPPSCRTRSNAPGTAPTCAICALVFLFLIAPILVIIPLSFNAEPYFTFTDKMLRSIPTATRCAGTTGCSPSAWLDPEAPRDAAWWADAWANAAWINAAKNCADHRLASPRCSRPRSARSRRSALPAPRCRSARAIMAVLISPMIVPIIITATGLYFFYSRHWASPGTYAGHHPRPRHARHPLRRHHRDRDARRLRPVADPRRAEPRRLAGHARSSR